MANNGTTKEVRNKISKISKKLMAKGNLPLHPNQMGTKTGVEMPQLTAES